MAPTRRSLSLLALVVVAMVSAACSSSGGGSGGMLGPGQARLNIVIHDETSPAFSQANVTFSAIEVRDSQGVWVPVSGTFPMTIDLLTLVNGKTLTLAAGAVPAGTYDRIRVTIAGSELVLANGTTITITLPHAGVTVERMVSFTAVEGQPVTITLDFKVDLSFKLLEGMECQFEPEIDVESVEHEH
ncbi:MAG: DUF4382 domain-containing protein [Acidobacteriia bacterium]|nr:DUF4382 domain-containing protein [Terriglobia bacterium]